MENKLIFEFSEEPKYRKNIPSEVHTGTFIILSTPLKKLKFSSEETAILLPCISENGGWLRFISPLLQGAEAIVVISVGIELGKNRQ